MFGSTLQMVRHPDPRLEQVSATVEEGEFGADMLTRAQAMNHLRKIEGGIGIAGVQVGDMRRILLAVVGEKPAHQASRDATFFANPVITAHGDTVPSGFKEGCLSYPKLKVNIHRYAWIVLEWRDFDGSQHTRRFEGMDAIVLQHEMDHLDGKTLLQQASSTAKRKFATGKLPRPKKTRRSSRR